MELLKRILKILVFTFLSYHAFVVVVYLSVLVTPIITMFPPYAFLGEEITKLLIIGLNIFLVILLLAYIYPNLDK